MRRACINPAAVTRINSLDMQLFLIPMTANRNAMRKRAKIFGSRHSIDLNLEVFDCGGILASE